MLGSNSIRALVAARLPPRRRSVALRPTSRAVCLCTQWLLAQAVSATPTRCLSNWTYFLRSGFRSVDSDRDASSTDCGADVRLGVPSGLEATGPAAPRARHLMTPRPRARRAPRCRVPAAGPVTAQQPSAPRTGGSGALGDAAWRLSQAPRLVRRWGYVTASPTPRRWNAFDRFLAPAALAGGSVIAPPRSRPRGLPDRCRPCPLGDRARRHRKLLLPPARHGRGVAVRAGSVRGLGGRAPRLPGRDVQVGRSSVRALGRADRNLDGPRRWAPRDGPPRDGPPRPHGARGRLPAQPFGQQRSLLRPSGGAPDGEPRRWCAARGVRAPHRCERGAHRPGGCEQAVGAADRVPHAARPRARADPRRADHAGRCRRKHGADDGRELRGLPARDQLHLDTAAYNDDLHLAVSVLRDGQSAGHEHLRG
jgi:hypothetical protein